jgi:epsilon-lactone hydrolase
MFSIMLRLALLLAVSISALAQQQSYVYVPPTVSPEWQQRLAKLSDPAPNPQTPPANDIAAWKKIHDDFETMLNPEVEKMVKTYGATVTSRTVGTVPVVDIKPGGWTQSDKLLVYTHGGAYTLFSARSSLGSALVAASATGLRVISIDYTVAPNAKWDVITDQVISVFKALQKDEGFKLKNIAIYGDSAGGGLAAGAVLKMRDLGLGMPAVVILWSPWSDITDVGDTYHTLRLADPAYLYEKHLKTSADAYADPKDQKNPYVSPVYGDYSKGFPPTIIQGGTKEIFLSNFIRQYQAIDSAGGIAKLDIYEGMTHCFMTGGADTPEGKLALSKVKKFVDQYLGK